MRLDRIGTQKKPKVRKPEKRCPECGRTFKTRSRHARHLLAHRIAAEEPDIPLAAVEDRLSELERTGELIREHDGYRVADE